MRGAFRYLLWSLAIVITFSYAMFQGGYSSWFLFAATTVLFAYEWFNDRAARQTFQVTRSLSSTRLTAGGSLEVEIRATVKSKWPLPWLLIEDHLPTRLLLNSNPNRDLFYPWFSKTLSLRYKISQVPRGKYTFSDVRIWTGDLFGLTRITSLYRVPEEITVYPRVVPIKFWPALNKFASGNAIAQSRRVEETANVIGVRDYAPGDRLSRIHWPATARTGLLKTKEFELHVSNDLLLILNRNEADYAKLPGSVFELAVTLLSSLAQYAAHKGYSLGLASYGKELYVLPAIRGIDQYRSILEHMAIVQPDGTVQLHESVLEAAPLLKRGASLVVVSPSLTSEMVHTAGLLTHRKIKMEYFLVTGKRKLSPAEKECIGKLNLLGARVTLISDEQEIADQVQGGNAYVASV